MNAAAIDLVQSAGGTAELGFSGFVHGVALVDLLQIFHYSRRSLTLHIEPHATIHVSDGEIVHARNGELEGELAISCLLERTSGRIRTAPAEVVPTSIQRSFNFLLLDALRGMDESNREPGVETWPEASGEFTKETFQVPRGGSLLPSVPAGGTELLGTACIQLAARIDGPCAVGLVDLNERRLLAHCGNVNRQRLEAQCLAGFERPELIAMDRLLRNAGQLRESGQTSPWLDEVRYVGQSGIFLGKALTGRALALVLCMSSTDSPGLAWAELRQSVRMVERIVP
jgi:Domain of unknown function (DUF4388)